MASFFDEKDAVPDNGGSSFFDPADTVQEGQSFFDEADKYDETNPILSAASGLSQGATLGFGDELAGAVGSALDRPISYIMDKVQGVPEDLAGLPEDSKFSDRYKETRDLARSINEKAQKDNPGAYLAGQVGGGIASSIATGGGAAGLGAKELVKRGAAEGAAVGLGNSNADLTEGEFGQAALDTGKGAVIGAALPLAGQAMGKVADKVAPVLDKVKRSAGETAQKVGDVLSSFHDEAGEMAAKGVQKILGSTDEVTPELASFLKSNGLNLGIKGSLKKGQEVLKKNIDDIISGAKEGDTELAKAAKEVLDNAKGELRGTRTLDTEDLVAFGLGGVKGVATKKAKDALWNRVNAKAPEILEGLSQAPTGIVNTASKVAGKAGDIIELTAEGVQRPSIVNSVATNLVDVPRKFKEDGVPLRKVDQQTFQLAQEANKKVTNDVMKLGLSKRESQQLGSKVEGLFYGKGQLLNENALGSPESLSESLISLEGHNLFDGKTTPTLSQIPILSKVKVIDYKNKPEELHNLVDQLNKVETLASIERSNNEVQNKINTSVKSFLDSEIDKKASSLYKTSKTRDQLINDFKNISNKLSEINNDPDQMQNYVGAKLGNLGKFAPETASGLSLKLSAGLQFLNDKIPKNPNSNPLNLAEADWRPSDQEISKFNKYKRAVEAPLSIFEDMNKGVLSREAVEAVQTVYPQLYSKFQSSVTESMTSNKTKLPYGKRIQLSLLMDQPLDSSMSPQSINTYQTTYAPKDQKGGGGASLSGKSASVDSLMTDSQRLNS